MPLPYTQAFFDSQMAGSATSADIIVPLVLHLFPSRSVIDVGCGVGAWLHAFARHGIEDHIGFDGDHVPRGLLQIPDHRFVPCDLTRPQDPGRRFDLACSLEVAEHLPEQNASAFVSLLVQAADVVLFSAAIPGQGGTDHRNEQWPSYWAGLFGRHGYVPLDCLRPHIFHDERIEFWYRQTLLVFCTPARLPPGSAPVTSRYELDRVHPGLVTLLLSGPQSGRAAARAIPRDIGVLGQSVLRKLVNRRSTGSPANSLRSLPTAGSDSSRQ